MSQFGGFLGGAGLPEPSNFNSAAPGIYSLTAANELRSSGYWPVPETSDPYYSITELLLSASTNGSRTATIRDISDNAFDLFVSGYTRARVIGPAGKPIDAVFNNGGHAYIKTPASSNLVIGTSDFTLEAWIWPLGNGTESQPIFDTRDNNGNNGYTFGIRNTDGYLFGGSNYSFANPGYAVAWRQWNHVAWVREGGVLRAYINGRLFGSPVSHGANYTNNFVVIGSNNYAPLGAAPFMGYIADARVTIGAARYTSPALLTTNNAPTTALPTTVIDDPYYSNVLLHMNFEGGTFKDISSFNRPVSSYGGAAVSTDQQRFGAASGYFDGNTGSYLSVPYSQDFDFGYDDFTIEMWLWLNNYDNGRCIISNGWPTNNYGGNFLFYTESGNLVFWAGQNATAWDIASNVPIVPSIVTNQWYHVAVCRSGGIFNLFSNGTRTNSFASNYPFALTTKSPVTLAGGSSGVNNVNCYIDDLRITRGVARYPRASYTPPVIPMPKRLQAGAPFAPTMLDGFYGDQSVTVSWRAAFNGGSALTGYTVEYSSDDPASPSATWGTSAAAANTLEAAVTGLTNETSYVFRMRATNALGNSVYSNTIGPFTPSAAVPLPILGANTSPAYTSYSTRQDEYYYSGTTAASLFDNNITDNTTNQWLTYSLDGGRGAGVDFNIQQQILRYRIWRNTNNQNTPTTWVLQGSNTASDYTNLSGWYNQQNVGSWVTIDTRTSVNIPVVSGSSPATQPYGEYRVASPGNYRYYRLFVTAVRADGPGTDASRVAIGEMQFLAVVPLPATPTALTGFPSDGGASLSWAAAGPRISNYTVEWSDDGGATVLGSATTAARGYDVTGLTNGTPYVFRVRTNNTTGSGTFTAWSTSVTPAAGDLVIEDNIFRFKVTAATSTVQARSSSTTGYIKMETTAAGTTYTSAVVGTPYTGYPYFMLPAAQLTSLPTSEEKTIRIISCTPDGTPSGDLTYVSFNGFSGQTITRIDASGCTALTGFSASAVGAPSYYYGTPQLPSALTEVRCVGVSLAGGFYSQWGPYPANSGEGLQMGNQQLSSAALNQMYTDLATKTVGYNAIIMVFGNPGTTGDNPTIATAKGYTVYGSGT
jgi:hypothetical protein